MTHEFALKVEGLNKSFPGSVFEKTKQVLFDVGFRVRSGVTTGFIGVNGSGKTTSLKCVLGFIHPQKGQISILGQPQNDLTVRGRIGYLPERPYLYEYLTAREFLKFHWQLTGGGSDFELACRATLERVNLLHAEDKRIRTYSKGMMQRVGFAQALLRDPEFLILDEPMSGLDPDGRYLIKDILRAEKKKNRTIFFSTHYLSDVEELCEDLIVIDQGRILYQGPTLDLVGRGSSRVRIAYQLPSEISSSEIIVDQDQVIDRLQDLKSQNGRVLGIASEHVGLEVAFKSLRGQKDSGS